MTCLDMMQTKIFGHLYSMYFWYLKNFVANHSGKQNELYKDIKFYHTGVLNKHVSIFMSDKNSQNVTDTR